MLAPQVDMSAYARHKRMQAKLVTQRRKEKYARKMAAATLKKENVRQFNEVMARLAAEKALRAAELKAGREVHTGGRKACTRSVELGTSVDRTTETEVKRKREADLQAARRAKHLAEIRKRALRIAKYNKAIIDTTQRKHDVKAALRALHIKRTEAFQRDRANAYKEYCDERRIAHEKWVRDNF